MNNETEILSLPIKGMQDYVLAAGACPKNAWGKEVVGIVNEAIKQFRNTPDYHQHKEYWLDENSRHHYRKYVADYFAGAAD